MTSQQRVLGKLNVAAHLQKPGSKMKADMI